MTAPEPTSKPPYNRSPAHEGPLSQHPAVRATARGLNLVGGLAASALALLVVGVLAAWRDCLGEETHGLCAGSAWLVPVLEWPILAIAVLAPLAGGVAAFATRRPRWLALGVGMAFVMLLLMLAVATGQTGRLS